ncbi:MAG: cation diffusion facilitator family transporter, partial [Candidatus Bipolaricaulaceae bacterium]
MRAEREQRLLLASILALLVFFAELFTGILAGSLALLADSAHVFLDVVALGLAYLGARLSRRPPTTRYTYGFRRVEVLTAAVNGLTLLLLLGLLVKEAFARLGAPRPVQAGPMLGVALAGLLVNFLMAGVLWRHEEEDLNMRAAFLHVLGDAFGSLAALAAGVVIALTGWTSADPLASLVIAASVGAGAVRVLRHTFRVLAEGVPAGLNLAQITHRLREVSGVRDVHDLHLWSIGPGFPALSAHVVVESASMPEADALAAQLRQILKEEFGLDHVTLQLEGNFC